MTTRDPIELAKQLGLDFDTTHTVDGKYVRFAFHYPDSGQKVSGPGGVSPAQIDRSKPPPVSKDFQETVARVTRWREKVKPWLFVGTVDTVAVKMNVFTRTTVGKFNLRNSRKIKKLAKSEEEARRIAQTQPTPHQGIVVLDSLTELKEYKTRELRDRLIARCEAMGRPWEGKPTPQPEVKVAPVSERLWRFAPHAVAFALLLALLGAVVWAFS